MLAAVFISDLHLNSEEPQILARFNAFVEWALVSTRAVYVLGDLFHVWAGDSLAPDWSFLVAKQFQRLVASEIPVYFMPGNRDFLLGSAFAKQAGFKLLPDPTVINLEGLPVLLAHGDAYCLLDKAHQRFRRFTRNALFIKLFLLIPRWLRQYLVTQVRKKSQEQRVDSYSSIIWEVVPEALIKDMKHHQVNTLIHGHIHKPGLTEHERDQQHYRQFVLSDWDDFPKILGYNKSSGFKFIHPVVF